MENEIRKKVEQLKALAEEFFDNKIKVYVKDVYNNYYFANIVSFSDDGLKLLCFSPDQRKGLVETLPWTTVSFIFKYKESGR